MKRKLTIVLIVLFILILLVGALLFAGADGLRPAEEAPEPTPELVIISAPEPTPEPTPVPTPVPEYPARQLELTLDYDDWRAANHLFDDDYGSDYTFDAGEKLTLTADGEIRALYIIFGSYPDDWTLRVGEREIPCGRDGFLHEYIPLDEGADSVVIELPEDRDVLIRDVYAFSEGYPPPFVQTWKNLDEPADVLIFSTHYDDELLFMGGIIPYYAGVRGLKVQVVYMTSNYLTNFSNYRFRPHEALNGLWTCYLHYYPLTHEVPDYECDGYWAAVSTYGQDEFAAFQTEMIRRFKPLVVVTQAEDGEYGHGAHILTALSVERAVEAAADPDEFPESAARWGTWDTPKTYLHKYGDPNEITILNYERRAPELGGRTPFEVAQEAYRQHLTQQKWVGFYVYNFGHPQDSHRYGLYRSLVGPDEDKNDLMEHVTREMFPAG